MREQRGKSRQGTSREERTDRERAEMKEQRGESREEGAERREQSRVEREGERERKERKGERDVVLALRCENVLNTFWFLICFIGRHGSGVSLSFYFCIFLSLSNPSYISFSSCLFLCVLISDDV